jgi:tight adherence protein B
VSSARTLAHLLEAGIPANQAWQLSMPVIEKLPASESAELELVWGFATRIGAPLGEAMSQFHEFARDQARSQREREQAQAVPAATRKLLLGLPLASLGFAQLAGFDVIRGLSHPVGMASAVLAAGLLWLGARWSRSYLALPDEPRAEVLTLILMQLALRSGIGVTAAKRLCLAELEKLGVAAEFESAAEVVALSTETGAAVADLMLARATELREQAATRAITVAQKASVKLLLPLGLTALPAFLLLTLTPIFISLVTQ